jgi:MYXO-CTERM domain-containing protein
VKPWNGEPAAERLPHDPFLASLQAGLPSHGNAHSLPGLVQLVADRFPLFVVLSVSLLVAGAVPPAAAQDPGAPALSPTLNKLYAHHHDSDTEELNGWMNAHVTDPTGNDVALGPAAPEAQPLPDRVYTFTLMPGLAAPVKLDPAGNIVIEAYIGAGGSQGVVQVSTALTYDGQEVVAGEPQNHVYQQAGTAAYGLVTWTLAPAILEFAPGKDLVWTVTLSGVAVQTVFMSVSAERGSSSVALPILATGPQGPGSGSTTTAMVTNTTTTSSTSSSATTSANATSSASSSTAESTTSDSSSSTTDATAGDETEDAPGLPIAATGLALLAVAIALRRRLA